MKKIEYHHKNSGIVAYNRLENSDGSWYEYTYNEKGNPLTCKDSSGYWYEYTYDEGGNRLIFKNSRWYWSEYTYNESGKQLTYKNSIGYWTEYTYDEDGKQLTYKDSYGCYRIKGKFASKEEFEQFLNTKPCLGKKVLVDGVEYILS